MTVRDCKVLIIGTGPAGLGAADSAKASGLSYEVLEAQRRPFGHCKSFTLPGYPEITFDEGPHISFTKNKRVQEIFERSSPDFITLQPEIENYWNGNYIQHPVQANLRSIPEPFRAEVVESIKSRPNTVDPKNYDEWLKTSFGERFQTLFHEVYTKKYWTVPSTEMTTDWIGERVYRPDADVMIKTAYSDIVPDDVHYITHFRYPRNGGFESFLKGTVEPHLTNIRFNASVAVINTEIKSVTTVDGKTWNYDLLFTSLPTDSIANIIVNAPESLRDACSKLSVSSVTLHSFIYKSGSPSKNHWMYVYDEDIPFARLHFPKKLVNLGDESVQAVQVEVYSSRFKNLATDANKRERIVRALEKMQILTEADILEYDVRFCKYANVIFDHQRQANVAIAMDYLNKKDIYPIGRFGKWAYLWSDESYLDGFETLKKAFALKCQTQ
jgi:protoporphyrinogen oxidase